MWDILENALPVPGYVSWWWLFGAFALGLLAGGIIGYLIKAAMVSDTRHHTLLELLDPPKRKPPGK